MMKRYQIYRESQIFQISAVIKDIVAVILVRFWNLRLLLEAASRMMSRFRNLARIPELRRGDPELMI